MSSSKQLIINCGASRVTAAIAEATSGGLEFEKLVTIPLDYDFSDDDSWLGAVRSALHELSHQHHFSGKATVIIPGSQVLTKTIRIPHVEQSKRAQILAFEAQQNIPYPLHEVVWDSQVVGDDGVETEVLIIACKSNTINEICSSVSAAGFKPVCISAATILEYNTIQFSQPELADDALVVNVGARTTNLIFKSADGFFARNIQLGGNTLTQNIADSLGKSFSHAEDVKQKFFTGDLDYTDEDSGAKLLRGSADAFIRRMGQEITRSIVNYRRQKNAPAPARILLTGRGSLLRGLSEQLATSQKIPVEIFDPLSNVTLGEKVTADTSDLQLEIGEIVGQACRELVANGAGVNLLPDEVQAELAFKAKKPLLLAAAVCLALAPWPAFLVFKDQVANYKDQARALQAQAGPLQARQSAIAEAEEKARAVSDSIELVEGLVNSKANWIQFFATLQESLTQVEDVWLDDLEVVRAESAGEDARIFDITLRGQMLVRESAKQTEITEELQAVLTRRIKLLQSSFESSEFIKASRPPSINFENLQRGLYVLPFRITLEADASKTL